MFTEKLVVSLLMFCWKFMGFVFLGFPRQKVAVESVIAEAYSAPKRRSRYVGGLIRMTFLALLTIGVPLADTDPQFKTNAGYHAETLIRAVVSPLYQWMNG